MTEDGKQINEGDGTGKEPNTPAEKGGEPTELDKLKADNDKFEKELVRGRQLKAESQKLEAEKMLGGTAGGKVEPTEPAKLTDQEYSDKFMKGEADPLGDDGIGL